MSIGQISTRKYGSGRFESFKISRKFRPGGRLRHHSDQSEDALKILNYFCLIKKKKKSFFILFCNFLLSKQSFVGK